MKNGLIDARFLFASSSFARFAAASVEFVLMAASIVRLLQAQTIVSRTLKPSLSWQYPNCRLSQANAPGTPRFSGGVQCRPLQPVVRPQLPETLQNTYGTNAFVDRA